MYNGDVIAETAFDTHCIAPTLAENGDPSRRVDPNIEWVKSFLEMYHDNANVARVKRRCRLINSDYKQLLDDCRMKSVAWLCRHSNSMDDMMIENQLIGFPGAWFSTTLVSDQMNISNRRTTAIKSKVNIWVSSVLGSCNRFRCYLPDDGILWNGRINESDTWLTTHLLLYGWSGCVEALSAIKKDKKINYLNKD